MMGVRITRSFFDMVIAFRIPIYVLIDASGSQTQDLLHSC